MKTSSRYLSSSFKDDSLHIFSVRSHKHEMMPVMVWDGGWSWRGDIDFCGSSFCGRLFVFSLFPFWHSHSGKVLLHHSQAPLWIQLGLSGHWGVLGTYVHHVVIWQRCLPYSRPKRRVCPLLGQWPGIQNMPSGLSKMKLLIVLSTTMQCAQKILGLWTIFEQLNPFLRGWILVLDSSGKIFICNVLTVLVW